MIYRGTILIADDDVVWSESVTACWKKSRICHPGSHGCGRPYQARMRRPDLILLNPRLRQLSGWEVCRMLKRTPDGPDESGDADPRSGGRLPDRSRRVPDQGGQLEPTLPPVRVFRYPAQGILEEFLHRHNAA